MSGKSNFYTLPQFLQVGLLYSSELKNIIHSPLQEKIKFFTRKKHEGTELFNNDEFSSAIEKYYQALTLFRWIENNNPNWNNRQINDLDLVYKNEEINDEVKNCLITSYLNIAICSLKLEQWKEAELACNEVLKIDEKNVKALYRKAQAIASPALAGDTEYSKSLKLLKNALAVDPKNIVVWQKFNEIKQISEEKSALNELKKNSKDAVLTPFTNPINELDDMVAKWEYMVNHMSPAADSSDFMKFKKNLEKIKKYKSQLKTSLSNLSENEISKLKTNKFGIDISDFIFSSEIKEAKKQGVTFLRSYPLFQEESWSFWYYIFLGFIMFLSLFIYNIESKRFYGY